MNLVNALIFSVGFNLAMFLPAFFLRTDKLTDFSYALTFSAVAVAGLLSNEINFSKLVLVGMVLLWSVRLGSYLLIRIGKIGKDKRFDGMRENFWRFGRFWLLQGLTVWVVMIPSIMFLQNAASELPSISYLGVLLWFVGLAIETIADQQKFRFISNPVNKGKWIQEGLWKYSRHPNYFGEILLWVGIYLFTMFGLHPAQALIGAIGPLYIVLLIIFVSGIPLLEKAADKRWGNDEKYREYKKRTRLLVPLWQKSIN